RAAERGHRVRLLTSHPEVVSSPLSGLQTIAYRTFADLRGRMHTAIVGGQLDSVIHCAAVSDYESAGIFAPAAGTHFDAVRSLWQSAAGPRALTDRSAGKVKSDEPELWLRLVRTPKLVDLIRSDWGFRGILVKFKLEVGVDEERLRAIAEKSRVQSKANL